jgi:anion-transporting  ArsA/GET3 family ATPase
MSLAGLVAGKNLIICVGSGGVGKTTTAAAIGLQAAREGRKVLVLTIDPARRLANSLGLSRFGNEETRIDLSVIPEATGELWAMMLDQQKTFDDLIHKLAPDDESRKNILTNRIYRATADNISGSQDYMATEMLYDVVSSGRYDLVVLDTPPVKNALDFLEAPGQLARFLDKRVMKWFLQPYDEGRVFGRLLMGTSSVVFRLLGYIFGKEFLADLAEYFHHFRDLYEGFAERHQAVVQLFKDKGTAFIIVSAPSTPSLDVAEFFLDELGQRGMANPGVIVNQRHMTLGRAIDPATVLGPMAKELAADLPAHTAGALMARLGASHRRLRELAHVEDGLVDGLRRRLRRGQIIWSIPRLEEDVHDLPSLARIGGHLREEPDDR